MRHSLRACGLAVLTLTVAACSTPQSAMTPRPGEIITIDRVVNRVSDLPANKGQPIGLFVREKVPAAVLAAGKAEPGKVALFVHGGYSPATLAFDLAYRDYSWMGYLAAAGYDVFAMDMTGYGRSSRPMMDNPCNFDERTQKRLIPKTLAKPCKPTYPYELVSSDTETSDIDRVVDFIRELRGVDKVTLIGWSGGGIRTGTYTVRHQDKVDKLIIQASSNYSRKNPDNPPRSLPVPGVPMTMQTRAVGETDRWLGTQTCANQVEPGIPDVVWNLSLDLDPLAATWGAGGLRAPTRTYWGWNANSAAKIKVPVLIMVGEADRLTVSNRELLQDLGSETKVFLGIACGTHFTVWEKQHEVLQRASLDWLRNTSLNGAKTGIFRADEAGRIAPAQ
jgi:pimeloyl-ACP methyl ester carboxylesterase